MSTEDKDIKTTDQPVDSADAHQAHHGEEPLLAEPDRPNVAIIGIITLAISITVVATVIGVHQFFSQTIYGEIQKKQLEPEDPLKREIAAYETARLGKYQWVSQKDGVVRIPVDRAKELVLADYGKMAAYAPQVEAPKATQPEPASSAEAASSAGPLGSASAAPSASAPAPSASAPASASAAPPASASAKPHHHH
jgi:hypothetical protein